MELHLRIVTADGEYTVRTTLYNIVELERKYGVTAADLVTGVSIEQLGFLAHVASKAAGLPVPIALDDFLRSLVNLTVVDAADEDPSGGGQ